MKRSFYDIITCLIDNAAKLKYRYKYFRPIVLEKSDYINAKPFNFYTSPYPDIIEIHNNEKKIFDRNKEILDIDLNIDRQFELLKEIEHISLPNWKSESERDIQVYKYRYYYGNGWFDQGSADVLFYMINIIRPQNIIEVGSGFSTAVMLDTNENYFKNNIKIYSIEPRPDRLYALLKPSDNLKIYEKNLQDVPVSFFEKLNSNDILFIDSSHVSKVNSDVNYLFFEIIPRLKEGIYIHFHDVFYPFIYPKKWIYEGRAYSEMYLLRAFLMNNEKYSIQFWGDMLRQKYSDRVAGTLSEYGNDSLWIKKMK